MRQELFAAMNPMVDNMNTQKYRFQILISAILNGYYHILLYLLRLNTTVMIYFNQFRYAAWLSAL